MVVYMCVRLKVAVCEKRSRVCEKVVENVYEKVVKNVYEKVA
jgi:hypothetical protein